MSRKRRSTPRIIQPDSVHGHLIIAQFINKLMIHGKKRLAERIVYGALDKLSEKTKVSHVEAFEQAINNVKPVMEVKSRRVGGSTYQVPVEVKSQRSLGLAIRWIIKHSRSQSGRSMVDSLASELEDAFNNVGSSVKTRTDTHKMAESNKAFSHFRW